MNLSRRDFLRTSGALIVSFSLAPESVAAQGFNQGFNGPGSNNLDGWLAIDADGMVTAYTGKCELGHGLYTAQTQLIAEELSVPFSRVRLIQCDTALTPDQGTTSGAQSHPTNFNHGALALAGATAREALLRMASTRLGADVQQLALNDGVISVKSAPSKKVTYGELIGGKKFNLSLNTEARRRDPRQWTVLGASIPRVEIPSIVNARFEYVHNVRVPGMLHGQVVRPPAYGAKLVRVDANSVQDLPGIVKVVVKNDFVGVVAEKPWQAIKAASQLRVTWSAGGGLPNHSELHDYLRNRKPTRDSYVVNSKDVDQKIAGAAKVIRATYHYPYQMHGSFGSSCAVADVQNGKALIYSATQAVYPLRSSIAMLLDLKPGDVHVIFRMGSGCYGVNGADTVSYDAALLSQAAGRPVRVQLTRKDEMAWENYGVAFVIDQRAGLDREGNIVVWDHEAWTPTLGGRPGSNTPGNVITGLLAGFQPAPFAARASAPDPQAFGNNSNAAPAYIAGAVNGRIGGTGKIRSERVMTHDVQSPLFTGPLRSPARLQNTFAHESFMDEIAAEMKADPVEFRIRHLSDARLIGVLQAAASGARWDARSSPRPAARRTGVVVGRGISCVLYEGNNGYCAMVAEVEVNQDTGNIAVRRLVIASDVGPISNPDGLKNQLEGGALHGMSRALLEEVTWDDEKVTSIDWRTYHALPVGAEIPAIETILLNHPEAPATGAGETAVTVAAAAIGNAVFDATGVRLRQVPFTPERVKAEIAKR